MAGDEDLKGKPGTPGGEQPSHEAVERPWASNDKVQFDNLVSHCKRIDIIGEQSLQNAVNFAKQANDAYLEQANGQNKAALAMVQTLHHQIVENNRYTLDRLYSVFPEEATGIATMVTTIIETLKQNGWQSPASK